MPSEAATRDATPLVVDAGADLRDARVEGAGGSVGAADEIDLGGDGGVGVGTGDRVERGRAGFGEALDPLCLGAGGDERGGAGGVEEAVGERGRRCRQSQVRSPERTRMPQPTEMPCEAVLRMPSSMPSEELVTDSK